MRYAITGHTGTIGEALKKEFGGQGYTRSNGYNINDANARQQIITEVQNVDVFINCAHSNVSQAKMLEEWYGRFNDTNKIIINIGSLKMLHLQMDSNNVPSSMAWQNAALVNLFEQLLVQKSTCKVGLIELGPVAKGENTINLDTVVHMVKNMISYLECNSRCWMKLLPEVK